MGKVTGFLEFPRETAPSRPVEERIHDWKEIHLPVDDSTLRRQGARCMDCGIPFCHQGCPLGNVIPDWNDLVYRDRWREAIDALHATNNFPEFTGRLCPAPCEASCVVAINDEAVSIKLIEEAIAERAWEEGWIVPEPPVTETGKSVAIIGSGPAGLACAQQLRRVGHRVTVFERADKIGGLLRYGIPEFKMEKRVLDRRLAQMEAEGVEFRPGVNVGVDIDPEELRSRFDAIVLCGGARQPRDLPIPGRELAGIHFALDYLTQANKMALGEKIPDDELITAAGKKVVIIGGGDTGADCLGTAHRQGCASVYQFEIVPRPPDTRAPNNPWPQWSNIFRISSAHEEGGIREYQISTKEFIGDGNGRVKQLRTVRVNMEIRDGRPVFHEIPGMERIYDADLVLLAMGFVGAERDGLLSRLGVVLTPQGTVRFDENRMTNVPGVFAAGDMARGQSLIVWAIAEGRHTAHFVDKYLMGESDLPKPLEFGNEQKPFS